MKKFEKWYLFYSSSDMFSELAHTMADSIYLNGLKLHQAGAEIEFPVIFGFVSWRQIYGVKNCVLTWGGLVSRGHSTIVLENTQ